MRGITILALFALMLWLFAAGWLPLLPIPAIGICVLVARDKNGSSTDGVFVAGFCAVAVLFAVAFLKNAFSLL